MSTTLTQLSAPGTLSLRGETAYKYAHFLPSFDHDYKLPPLTPFEHVDPGHQALKDPEPRKFLEGAKVEQLTPKFGSEIHGVQLSALDERGQR